MTSRVTFQRGGTDWNLRRKQSVTKRISSRRECLAIFHKLNVLWKFAQTTENISSPLKIDGVKSHKKKMRKGGEELIKQVYCNVIISSFAS